jgi:hypothetical protein
MDWVYYALGGYYVSSGTIYELNVNTQGQAVVANTLFWNVRVVYSAATLVAGIIGCGIGGLAWHNMQNER